MYRKAQNASGAATLVAAIAALIVAYLLFIPPGDRQQLIGDSSIGGQGGQGGGGRVLPEQILLLQEPLGKVFSGSSDNIEHTIPSIKVFTRTGAGEIKQVDSLFVQRGAFEDKMKRIQFSLDPGLTHDVLLSFNVDDHNGRLIILLNGHEILNSELSDGSAEPIMLDSDYLQTENVLEFRCSSPGAMFWRVNSYELSEILISGQLTDVRQSFGEQHFSISQDEFESLKSAELKFRPNCDRHAIGDLQVLVNRMRVYEGLPQCNAVNTIEVAKSILMPEDNAIAFRSLHGVYEINNIKLETELAEPVDPVLYFEVPYQVYELLGDMGAYLTITFPDEGTKSGIITLNGRKANFRTSDSYYRTHVTSFIKEGTNSIKVKPGSGTLEVTEVRIEMR